MDRKILSLTQRLKSMVFWAPTASSTSKKSSPGGKRSSPSEGKSAKKCKPETGSVCSTSTTTTTTTASATTVTKESAISVGRRKTRTSSRLIATPASSASSASSVTYAYNSSNTLPLKRKRAPFQCIICMSDYTNNIPHNTDKCQHSMCRECVRKYFLNLLEKPMKRCDMIACPQPGYKEYFITDKVLYNFFTKSEIKNWWKNAIIQTHIENRIYCPVPRCRAIFDADLCITKKCTFVVCRECNRGFCSTCQKKWHPGEIKFIDDEADLIKILKKAEDSNWTRCPKCSAIVEKIHGCSTMVCTCKTVFCYRCGGLSDDHTCRNRCDRFDAAKLRSVRSPMFVVPKKQRI